MVPHQPRGAQRERASIETREKRQGRARGARARRASNAPAQDNTRARGARK